MEDSSPRLALASLPPEILGPIPYSSTGEHC
jgi:hypothetical protein